MPHPLDEAHAKVSRAKAHLEELDRKARTFIEGRNYRLALQTNPYSDRVVFVTYAKGHHEPPPVEFGIIAGDIAHNLRSALNYLTWRLAIPPVGTGPGDATQFPIFFNQAGKAYKKSPLARFRDGENGYLAGVTKAHRAVIERAQPYHGGSRQHLAFLAQLSNRDKHQLVATTLTVGHIEPVALNNWPSHLVIVIPFRPLVYDGAEVAELRSYDPTYKLPRDGLADVHMKFDIALEIAFGESPMMIGTMGNLLMLTRYVELILRVFRDAF